MKYEAVVMTEEEWLASNEPQQMIGHLPAGSDGLLDPTSCRKLRLFAVACFRRIQHLLHDQAAVERRLEIAERHADGLATDQELRTAQFSPLRSGAWFEDFGHDAAYDSPIIAAMMAHHICAAGAELSEPEERSGFLGRLRRFFARPPARVWAGADRPNRAAELSAQCELFRDLFGNPFRPVAFDPAWRTTDVMLLASGIYAEKAFDRMPILADALQDAGCDNDDILNHCRTAGPHVRGCWACDLVLGKE
jgi:hypothetical protein